jgi:hypothetical protein
LKFRSPERKSGEISKTYEGFLQVRVTAKNNCEFALAIYEDNKTFLRLVKHAGLRPEDERCVEKAVVIAFSLIRTESLCEDLELSEEQLSFLRLSMARQIFA